MELKLNYLSERNRLLLHFDKKLQGELLLGPGRGHGGVLHNSSRHVDVDLSFDPGARVMQPKINNSKRSKNKK